MHLQPFLVEGVSFSKEKPWWWQLSSSESTKGVQQVQASLPFICIFVSLVEGFVVFQAKTNYGGNNFAVPRLPWGSSDVLWASVLQTTTPAVICIWGPLLHDFICLRSRAIIGCTAGCSCMHGYSCLPTLQAVTAKPKLVQSTHAHCCWPALG